MGEGWKQGLDLHENITKNILPVYSARLLAMAVPLRSLPAPLSVALRFQTF